MTKNLKNSFPLLLMSALTACGLAEPSDPFEENPDTDNPIVISSSPVNKGELSYETNQISLTLNEAIDPASLATLNALEFKSGTTTLAGTWTFDSITKELVFTLDNRDAVAAEQIFKLGINGEITDLAGNALVWNLEFNTPALFDINLTATGLSDDDSLIVTQTKHGSSDSNTVTVDANGQVFTLQSNLAKEDHYYLSISQAAQNSFCALSSSSGEISNNDIDVTVKCHNVQPLYTTASDWNQYHLTDEQQWVHGGELRTTTFPELQSCDNLTAKDELGAFDWTCTEETVDNATQVNITSTNLKSDVGLRDLITFDSSPNWKENRIEVMNGNQIVAQSGEGIWWNNPIVNANTTILSTEGAIYVAQDETDLNRRFELAADGVSLLIKPGETLQPSSNNAGVLISNNSVGTWFEGEINARNSHIGIQVNRVSFATLKFVTVSNSEGNGIEINDTLLTIASHIQALDNDGNGIYISSNQVTEGSNVIKNAISANNSLSGINLAGTDASLIHISSANNDENGIIVSGNNNKLINISTNNNRLDGLVISGASNNIVNSATTTSNGGSGLRFSQSGGINDARNNLLSNITSANNLSSGVKFDATDEANSLFNVLDAYNAALDCPETSCDNVTTISINDIATIDLFSPIGSETNIINFEVDATYHVNNANSFTEFENEYRAWGSETAATEEAGGGTCNNEEGNNSCKLFDWTLNATESTTARDQLTAVNTNEEHTFYAGTPFSFLSNAFEIMGDGIGNDNSLCETNEACILTSNIGSYQGHGEKTELTDTNDLNATLYKYNDNGR